MSGRRASVVSGGRASVVSGGRASVVSGGRTGVVSDRRLRSLLGVAVAVLALGGCGSESATPTAPALSPAAEAGRDVAKDAGCMSCHGANAEGGVGPGWQGLAGSTRPLTDGTEVVADREYLERSITDPSAQKVDGYAVAMPVAGLTDEQVASIVDYIEALG